jgi:hypothetical protein
MSGLPRSQYLMRPKFLSRYVFAHASATAFLISFFHLTGFCLFSLPSLLCFLAPLLPQSSSPYSTATFAALSKQNLILNICHMMANITVFVYWFENVEYDKQARLAVNTYFSTMQQRSTGKYSSVLNMAGK